MPARQPSDAEIRRLAAAARRAAAKAYAPYSRFPVGAAVLASSGRTYSGTNVENASFGLSLCAERSALAAAVAAGERKFRVVAIYTPTQTATAPCGACRQFIHEFGAGIRVVSTCDSRERIDVRIATLLPGAFGPADLGPVA